MGRGTGLTPYGFGSVGRNPHHAETEGTLSRLFDDSHRLLDIVSRAQGHRHAGQVHRQRGLWAEGAGEMIPVALIAEAIPALLALARWIRGLMPDEEQEKLKEWANLIHPKVMPERDEVDTDWQEAVNQFLTDLTLRKGYSPAYTWDSRISVPVDMLTDLVDLLVGGWSAGSKWSPANLLRNPVKDRLAWRTVMASENDALILAEADAWLAKRGRNRDYSPVPTIVVDRDHFADMVSMLVG